MFDTIVIDGRIFQSLEEIETIVLFKRLKTFNYNRRKTAESLGRSKQWLRMKIRELERRGAKIPNRPLPNSVEGNNSIH